MSYAKADDRKNMKMNGVDIENKRRRKEFPLLRDDLSGWKAISSTTPVCLSNIEVVKV
jgi:hypothetical protein